MLRNLSRSFFKIFLFGIFQIFSTLLLPEIEEICYRPFASVRGIVQHSSPVGQSGRTAAIHLLRIGAAVAPEDLTHLIMIQTSGARGNSAASICHQKNILSRTDHADRASGVGIVLILFKR